MPRPFTPSASTALAAALLSLTLAAPTARAQSLALDRIDGSGA